MVHRVRTSILNQSTQLVSGLTESFVTMDEDCEESTLNRRVSGLAQGGPQKRSGSVKNSSAEILSDGEGYDLVVPPTILNFIYCMAEWKEAETGCEKVGIAINMPTGVENFAIQIVEGGYTMVLKLTWPKEFLNPMLLLEKFFQPGDADKIEKGHAKVSAFEQFLQTVRENQGDSVESFMKIRLSFPVHSAIHHRCLEWETGTRALYIELTASRNEYAVKRHKGAFEKV